MARSVAVFPFLFLIVRSAPLCNNRTATISRPEWTNYLILARAIFHNSEQFLICKLPREAAMCRAVLPSLFAWFIFAFRLISNLAISSWPKRKWINRIQTHGCVWLGVWLNKNFNFASPTPRNLLLNKVLGPLARVSDQTSEICIQSIRHGLSLIPFQTASNNAEKRSWFTESMFAPFCMSNSTRSPCPEWAN